MRGKIIVVLTFILLLLNEAIYPQQQNIITVKGTVTDRETGEPLSGASVYFGTTTIGSVAQKNGNYLLETNRQGNYEIIVSMVGFASQKSPINIRKGNKYTIDFKLEPKPVDVNTVEVEGDDQTEWRRCLNIFSRKFLGSMEPYYSCEIENKEILNFKWMSDTLVVLSPKPLVIINNYLGYKTVIDLRKFIYNIHTTEQELLYTSFFTELSPAGRDQLEKWKKNREKIFYGSPVHFLWAFKNNNWRTEGFRVNYAADPTLGKNEVYREITNTDDLLSKDQFLDEPLYSFNGCLKITYKNNQTSFIRLRHPFFTVDENGIADNHLPFLCMGYWADLGVADMLPLDYLPQSLKN